MNALSFARAVVLSASLAAAQGCTSDTSQSPSTSITSQIELRDSMRELWTAHVIWTRVFLISTIAGLPDAQHATERLLQNQDDIGNALRPFYGEEASARLRALLRAHITGAAGVVTAAQGGDAARLAAANADWYANADEIASFLAGANPFFQPEALRAMLRMHLDQTSAEATLRLAGDWSSDAANYDKVVDHALLMADALSSGVAQQFPGLVRQNTVAESRGEALHRGMRALWQDHVSWTRLFLISALAQLPDSAATSARLLRNQDDLANAVRSYYGDAGAARLGSLLRAHITGAAEVVTAAQGGDAARLSAANADWYANADEIASFLAGANPNWRYEQLRALMHAHLDQTAAEATARIEGNWAADVTVYDKLVEHILQMSDVLSAGITAQFPPS